MKFDLLSSFLFFNFWPHHVACGLLVLPPGIEPMPSAGIAWSLNHWTAREVPDLLLSNPSFILVSWFQTQEGKIYSVAS